MSIKPAINISYSFDLCGVLSVKKTSQVVYKKCQFFLQMQFIKNHKNT